MIYYCFSLEGLFLLYGCNNGSLGERRKNLIVGCYSVSLGTFFFQGAWQER